MICIWFCCALAWFYKQFAVGLLKHLHILQRWWNGNHYSDVIMRAMASKSPASRLFVQTHRSKKKLKLRVTGLCEGNLPVTGGFPHKGLVTQKMIPFDDVIMMTQSYEKAAASDGRLDCWIKLTAHKTSKLSPLSICKGNLSVIGGFPVQRASNAERIPISGFHRYILQAYF